MSCEHGGPLLATGEGAREAKDTEGGLEDVGTNGCMFVSDPESRHGFFPGPFKISEIFSCCSLEVRL